MSIWAHELRLFLRQSLALGLLLLIFALSAASVWGGVAEIAHQRNVITRIMPQQAADEAAVAARVSKDSDPGNAAYYTLYATWDAPSPLAFAALGQRDIAPYVLRVRALALEGQIYESENYNAQMALPGRFDWAFVLTYLAPLFLIALLHDLSSSEAEAGRHTLLGVMARSRNALWVRRIIIRAGLLFTALVAPFAVGGLVSGSGAAGLAVIALAGAYLLFWTLACLVVSRLQLSSLANAASLAAVWLLVTLVLPGLALLTINSAIPVRQGVELTLAQREAVHAAWDKPKDATMRAFFRHYPEWRETAPVEGGFHWKWYYAFQHLGDLSVAEQVRAYRAGLMARDTWTRRIGYVLPSVGVQVAVHRLARTDLEAQLSYQDRIRKYHERLRRFYYPYVFDDRVFSAEDFAKAPRWK
jgi:ABC-2 type transport system permease protein